MPRPRKCRRVCRLPSHRGFSPLGENPCAEPVMLRVEEYEAIRLIDLEGLTQEECAQQMGVARTTVTGIVDQARRKLAEALVHGRPLRIQGGDFILCDQARGCKGHCSHRPCPGKCRSD